MDENIVAVRELLEEDRCLTIDESASSVGLSYGNVHSIIKEDFEFSKITARWILCPFPPDQNTRLAEVIGPLC